MTSSANEPLGLNPDEALDSVAQGHAAFMLLESLLISQVENGDLDSDVICAAIEDAIDTNHQMVIEGQNVPVARRAAGALKRLASSLRAAKKPDPL